jgi:hypothetical protein
MQTFELPTDAGGACTLDLSALGAGDTHYVLQVGADGITQLVPVAHTQTSRWHYLHVVIFWTTERCRRLLIVNYYY